MRGLVLAGVGRVALRTDLPEPRLEAPTDALVAVHAAGLCGSDLHPYEGREPAGFGVVQGHEVVGEVVACGTAVTGIEVGQRVLAAFSTSCGTCPPCRRGLTARCVHSRLLGWGPPDPAAGAALHGAQAERVRIPHAQGTLVPVPDELDDATALLCTDNLPTAWEAVARAEMVPGEPLVVVGLGAVGLCATAVARALGADPVIGVDPVADRRARAASLGAATTLDPVQAVAHAAELASPAVVEASGSVAGQRLAVDLVRPGGVCSIIAVQTAPSFALSPIEAYDRNLTLRLGRASARATLEHLLPRVVAGTLPAPTAACVTHRGVPLEQGPSLYARFAAREPGLLKAGFTP